MLASLALTVAAAAVVAAQSGLTINTPTSVVECQPVALSWNGGTAPYFVSIIPGGQAGATPLESFPEQSGTSYTWTADIAAGTSLTFQVKDSTGAINYSQQVSVQQGTSTSCVGAGGSSGASSAAAGGASSSAATAATDASSAAATSATAATSRAASAASSATGGAASRASGAASAASSAAGGVTSAAASAASSASSGTSDATKVGAGLFTVAAGALFALFA